MRRSTPVARIVSLVSAFILVAVTALAEEPAFPIKVNENARYFVDQNGKPVFWLGTTHWQLFRDYNLEDTKLIIERSKDNGFAFMQVMLMVSETLMPCFRFAVSPLPPNFPK